MTTTQLEALDHRRDRRHRPLGEAPRGRPLRRGPGQLPRRPHAAGHVAHGDPAFAGRRTRASRASTRRRRRRSTASSRSSPASCSRGYNLAWMPTMSGDTQAVLATDKVRFQGQEVAAVVATDPYIARGRARAHRRRLRDPARRSRRRSSHSPTAPCSSATTRKARPPTSSTSGSAATRRRPRPRSPRPTGS